MRRHRTAPRHSLLLFVPEDRLFPRDGRRRPDGLPRGRGREARPAGLPQVPGSLSQGACGGWLAVQPIAIPASAAGLQRRQNAGVRLRQSRRSYAFKRGFGHCSLLRGSRRRCAVQRCQVLAAPAAPSRVCQRGIRGDASRGVVAAGAQSGRVQRRPDRPLHVGADVTRPDAGRACAGGHARARCGVRHQEGRVDSQAQGRCRASGGGPVPVRRAKRHRGVGDGPYG
mmetsp:Transcript_36765/g.118270  ORF Transcript_36765/g.118270 Transcript_36765/m.118270 type:complete len:227 (+) Transcript_36765:99-779(+)